MKFEDLRKDMVAAMKEQNKEKKDAISSLIDATKKVAIDKGVRDNITDDLVNQVIMKELKSIKEQIDTCPSDRTDLLNQYKNRFKILESYAPSLMSKDDIIKVINNKFSDIVSTKNKGQIMKTIMPEFKGKADGKLINEIIEELCK